MLVPAPAEGSPTENRKTSRKARKIAARIGIVLGTLAVEGALGVGSYLAIKYYKQDEEVFHPTTTVGFDHQRVGQRTPAEYGLDFEPLEFPNRHGDKLRGFFIRHSTLPSKEAPTVVLYNGNWANSGFLLSHILDFPSHMNVFVADCSGRGGSDGSSPSEISMYEDAEDMMAFAKQHPGIDPDNLYVMGWSMGAAPAAKVVGSMEEAGDSSLKGLILYAPLPNLPVCATRAYQDNPILSRLAKFLVKYEMPTIEFIKNVKSTPVLVYGAEGDEQAGYNGAVEAVNACPSAKKSFVTLRGAVFPHELLNVSHMPGAMEPLAEFIKNPQAPIFPTGHGAVGAVGENPTADELFVQWGGKLEELYGARSSHLSIP